MNYLSFSLKKINFKPNAPIIGGKILYSAINNEWEKLYCWYEQLKIEQVPESYGTHVYVVRCATWYYLYNLKNVKNTHEGVLILVKLQASACNFTKINTPPWVFFTFFKLHKWYQIAQRITYCDTSIVFQVKDSDTTDPGNVIARTNYLDFCSDTNI